MTEKKLFLISQYALYAIVFLPLIYINGFYFPFIVNKTLWFRFAIEVAASAYLLLLIFDYAKYKPRFDLLTKLVGGLAAISIIVAIFGLDPYRSFFSDFERMEGVLLVIFLSVYFWLLKQFFYKEIDWHKYVRLLIGVSLLVSLYGIAQKYSLLPVFEAGSNRVASTIGNPAFLAGYLLLASALAAYLYAKEKDQRYKISAGVILVVNLFVIFLTATRGAILGLVIGAVVFLVLQAIHHKGKMRVYIITSLLFLFICVGAFIGFRNFFQNSSIEIVSRLATISLDDPNIKNRIIVWNWGWQSFLERPLFGVGLENFSYVYNKFYTPEISEAWFDRTHNIYLDQLVSNGILGLILYLSILAYLFISLWKNRQKDYSAFIVFTSFLVAYAIHNFFVFDALATAFVYFFILAFVNRQTVVEPEALSSQQLSFSGGGKQAKVVVLVIANILVLYSLVYLPLVINKNIFTGYYYVLADSTRSYKAFNKSLQGRYGSIEASSQLYRSYEALGSDPEATAIEKQKFITLSRQKLKQAVESFPLEIRNTLYLGQIIANTYRSTEELAYATRILSTAKELSPGRVEIYYLLSNIYAKQGDKDNAIVIIEELIERLPWYGEPKIILANFFVESDPERSLQLFDEGLALSYPDDLINNNRITSYLLNTERYKEAIPFMERMIELDPKIYSHRVDLARLYFLNSQIAEAVDQIGIVSIESKETLKGHEGFLSELAQKYDEQNSN